MFKSEVRLSGQIPDFDFQNTSKEILNKGIQEASNWQSSQFYTETILPLKMATDSYIEEFNIAVKNYMIENNMLKKMKDSLNPAAIRKVEIGIQRGKYQNNKKSTQHLMSTMLKGHSLLLRIRETLTGQHISTKFIIQTEKGVYQIDEEKIESKKLILSKYGGGTMSNPFSLAYQIDQGILEQYGILKEENEISKTDIWQTILSLKPEYLEWKKQWWWDNHHIKREYPNIFFDSKDAEIYELYLQQTGAPELSPAQYRDLRQQMGGGGGYATPFFKMGDIGSVQVKFFNFKKGNKKAAVNFARFSLLRDRFRQLSKIFSEANPQRMKNELINFFTEKNDNVKNIVSQEFNETAKKAIEKLFKNF